MAFLLSQKDVWFFRQPGKEKVPEIFLAEKGV
jgi:hypothetical protein